MPGAEHFDRRVSSRLGRGTAPLTVPTYHAVRGGKQVDRRAAARRRAKQVHTQGWNQVTPIELKNEIVSQVLKVLVESKKLDENEKQTKRPRRASS